MRLAWSATRSDRWPRSGTALRGGSASEDTFGQDPARERWQKIADSEYYKMPATIDDPAILDEIKVAVQGLGYAK